jgi:hypothetical protein
LELGRDRVTPDNAHSYFCSHIILLAGCIQNTSSCSRQWELT